MKRHINWDSKLFDYIDKEKGIGLEWGYHDCCTLGSGAVHAMTGTDPMAKYRGDYSSAIGAVKLLRKHGHKSLVSALDEALGEDREVPFNFIQRGDIMVITSSEALVLEEGWSEAVAVCLGEYSAVRSGTLKVLPTYSLNPVKCWRI